MHSAESHLMVEYKNTTIEEAASTKYLDQILPKLSAAGFVIRKVFLALHFITLYML
jgi:DNA-binding IscR family transcriptional regulator